jgi:hypothetical protein
MPKENTLANNPRGVSRYRRFCGTVGIANEQQGRALRKGRPLISASAFHHIRTATAMCGIPFQVLRFPSISFAIGALTSVDGDIGARLNSFRSPTSGQ